MLRQLADHCCLAGWMDFKGQLQQLPSCQRTTSAAIDILGFCLVGSSAPGVSGSDAGGWPAQLQHLRRTASSEPHSQVQQQQQRHKESAMSRNDHQRSKPRAAGQHTPNVQQQWVVGQLTSWQQPQLYHHRCCSASQHVQNTYSALSRPLQLQLQQHQHAQLCSASGQCVTSLNSLPILQQQLQQQPQSLTAMRCMSTDTKPWKKQQQQQQQGGSSSSSRGGASKKPQMRRNHQITARNLTVVFPDGTSQVGLPGQSRASAAGGACMPQTLRRAGWGKRGMRGGGGGTCLRHQAG